MTTTVWYCTHCDFRLRAENPEDRSCPNCKIPSEYGERSPYLHRHDESLGPLMSHEEVMHLRARLRSYYGEPVLPLNRVCDAFGHWFRAIEALNKREPRDSGDKPEYRVGHRWHAYLRDIQLAIRKSSMLGRLIYEGENLRTVECPEHKGKWSGLDHPEHPCPHGCHMTGWIPDPNCPVQARRESYARELESYPILTENDALSRALSYAMTTLNPPLTSWAKAAEDLKAQGIKLSASPTVKDGKTAYYMHYRGARAAWGWTPLAHTHEGVRAFVYITIESN